jgi:hypothetical protein
MACCTAALLQPPINNELVGDICKATVPVLVVLAVFR